MLAGKLVWQLWWNLYFFVCVCVCVINTLYLQGVELCSIFGGKWSAGCIPISSVGSSAGKILINAIFSHSSIISSSSRQQIIWSKNSQSLEVPTNLNFPYIVASCRGCSRPRGRHRHRNSSSDTSTCAPFEISMRSTSRDLILRSNWDPRSLKLRCNPNSD